MKKLLILLGLVAMASPAAPSSCATLSVTTKYGTASYTPPMTLPVKEGLTK